MKILRILSRVLVGLVFIYSGFVKGVDPIGSAYKFNDYFTAFGLDFLQVVSMPLAILLCTTEFLIGIALVIGLRMKITAWFLLVFMSFFTVLTLILALFNPVTDCGCFGDAVQLTNWQTFLKNLVLMAFTLFIFFSRGKYRKQYKIIGEWAMLGAMLIGFGILLNQSLNHLPIIDFRPFRVGTDIRKSMEVPEGAARDEFKTVLYYSKDGKTQEFTLDNYPWQDSSWIWVETKTIRTREGYKPPIHDFNIKGFDGTDITESVLADKEYSFLLITYNLSRANRKAFDKANELARYCARGNCKFYALTASSQDEVDSLKKEHALEFDFYHTDETTLKTIIRSNPGLMLIKDGMVIGHWHYNDFPDPTKIGENLMSYTLYLDSERDRRMVEWLFILILCFALALFKIFQLNFDRRT
jgi:uncharacterized membrane protein YphA (DoxX/SURF4 family)